MMNLINIKIIILKILLNGLFSQKIWFQIGKYE